jgi:hypothetical protein
VPARNPYATVIDFDWLVCALEPIVAFEQGRADQARVRAVAREIVAVCRSQRDRVVAAERILEEHRDILSADQKDSFLHLMAEALLYITYHGRRIKLTGDPILVLRGGSNER